MGDSSVLVVEVLCHHHHDFFSDYRIRLFIPVQKDRILMIVVLHLSPERDMAFIDVLENSWCIF